MPADVRGPDDRDDRVTKDFRGPHPRDAALTGFRLLMLGMLVAWLAVLVGVAVGLGRWWMG